jgi:membrane protease YdiL (CAAX protease family)
VIFPGLLPFLFSLGFTLLVVFVNETFSGFFHLLPDGTWMDILQELVFLIWPVALVLIFGFGFIFRQRGIRATFGAALPLFLSVGFVMVGQLVLLGRNPATEWKSGLEIFSGILTILGIGIREEILYRGVNANAIARKYGNTAKGLWITALCSGALFGAIHLPNVFHGVSFTGALMQSISAFTGGVLFCAIYLRAAASGAWHCCTV